MTTYPDKSKIGEYVYSRFEKPSHHDCFTYKFGERLQYFSEGSGIVKTCQNGDIIDITVHYVPDGRKLFAACKTPVGNKVRTGGYFLLDEAGKRLTRLIPGSEAHNNFLDYLKQLGRENPRHYGLPKGSHKTLKPLMLPLSDRVPAYYKNIIRKMFSGKIRL